jgi:hypothetical protein
VVVASFYLIIVVAAIVGAANDSRPFLGVGPDKVDLRIVEYLVVLVGCELVHVQLHHLEGPHRAILSLSPFFLQGTEPL